MSVPIAGHTSLTSGVSSALGGTCQAGGSAVTAKLPNSFAAQDGVYIGMTITITAGACSGQSRVIDAYTGATRLAHVSAAFTGGAPGPDATSVFTLNPGVISPTVKSWATLPMAANYWGIPGHGLAQPN